MRHHNMANPESRDQTDIDLRYNILKDARDLLLERTADRREVERKAAEMEGRAPKRVGIPSSTQITRLAQKLYDWVTLPDEGPEAPAAEPEADNPDEDDAPEAGTIDPMDDDSDEDEEDVEEDDSDEDDEDEDDDDEEDVEDDDSDDSDEE